MVCPNCGRPVGAGEKFCGSCGHPVYNEMRDDERRRKRNTAVVAVVVTVCILVLATFGRRMPDDFFQRWVQENFSEQQTAQTTEPPSEKLVFDIFTYYDPYTQTGLTQDEVIALHGEPQSVVQDPEGYTGAVEWQYEDRALRFWEGEVYYLQMRNTAWSYESTDDFSEMFHLLETERFWENAEFFYRAMNCGAYQVCIGYDAAALRATYLSVIYEIPEPWSVWLFGSNTLKEPPITFNLSELYNAETGYAASPEDIIALYGEPASITEDETDHRADKFLHYDYMRFGFVEERLHVIFTCDMAWSYESLEAIPSIFGLQVTEQTAADVLDVFYEARDCGIRSVNAMLAEDEGFLYSPSFWIE